MNIVIIGGGASGLTTASNIRKYDEESQVIVFTTQKNVAYSPCAIPYVIGGHIDSFDDIIMHKPSDYLKKNIRIMTETTVKDIDTDNTQVLYEDKNGNRQYLKYDKLVIATGGKPLIPPIEGNDLDGVFKVRTIEDGLKIEEYTKKSSNVILVGGGAIGLELGSELANKGLKVTIVEMMPQLFPRSFDKEMADRFKKHLESQGIKVLTNSTVEAINGTEKVESVTISGEEKPADMVILSTGVTPQTDLAESAGCKLGESAIEINDKMETSVENIYAAGDCVEVVNAITNKITLSPLGTTAVRQGMLLAKYLTGHDISFKPVLNSTVSKIGIMEMGAVGITRQEAEKQGIDVVVGYVDTLSKARYYPGTKPLHVALIAKYDGTVIGCQMFGQEAVAERIDTMATIISQKLKCDDIVSMEFAYAPPVSVVVDPIVKVAEDCQEKIDDLDLPEEPEEPEEDQDVGEVTEEAEDETQEEVEETEETEELIEETPVEPEEPSEEIAEDTQEVEEPSEEVAQEAEETEEPEEEAPEEPEEVDEENMSFTQYLRSQGSI